MAKAVIFVRVSTEEQSFESQRKEVIDMARRDGYTDSQLILIEYKESGYELSEDERKGLNDLKQAIEQDKEIKCVYVWDTSRLSRKALVNLSMMDYLVSHNVNLKSCKEGVSLFKDDGTLNDDRTMSFGMYALFAQFYREKTISQTCRTRRMNQQRGQKTNNIMKFGYTIDSNRVFIEKTDEADTIRTIFNLFETGKYTCQQIADELNQQGKTFANGQPFTRKQVNQIIIFKPYSGEVRAKGTGEIGNIYPMIVPLEQIERCIAIAASKKNQARAQRKYAPYCKGLLKDTSDVKQDGTFRTFSCDAAKGIYHNQSNRQTANLKYIDAIAWEIVKQYRASHAINIEELNRIKEQIQTKCQKLAVANKEIENINKKMNQTSERMANGANYSDILMNQFFATLEKLDQELKAKHEFVKQLEKDIEQQTQLIKSTINDSVISVDELEAYNTQKRIDLIHELVKECLITKVNANSADCVFIFQDETMVHTFYNSKTKHVSIEHNDVSTEFKHRIAS